MKFLAVLTLLLGVSIVMVVTNPNREDVDAEIESQLLTKIDDFDTNAVQDPVVQLITTTCKFGRSACASFIRSLLNATYEDKIIYSKITVKFGNEDPVQCYGAFTRVICPSL